MKKFVNRAEQMAYDEGVRDGTKLATGMIFQALHELYPDALEKITEKMRLELKL